MMKFINVTILMIVHGLCSVTKLECAKILAIIPTPYYSHQIPYTKLWLELNRRGHEIVLATTKPMSILNVTNITQIHIRDSNGYIKDNDFVRQRFEGVPWLTFIHENACEFSEIFVDAVFTNRQMKELYEPCSNATFDVVIVELFTVSSLLAFAHRFNAPLIGLSPLSLSSIEEHALGGLILPSHESTWENGRNTGSNLSFWKRMRNFYTLWRYIYVIYRDLFPHQQMIAEKYFGTNIPPLINILKNISVIFVNHDQVLTPAKLKLPNLLTFTSFHISNKTVPLPKDMKRFVEGAKNGFIYFNLGTNAQSSSMPNETIEMFLDVFAKLPYRILWKIEKELPGKPDNIFTTTWFPQQTILAQSNIKLFMYQGGVQSSQEAVHFAVPLLGFPVLGDQDYQVQRMEALGVGKYLELVTLTKDELAFTIQDIITNKKYKERMLEIRSFVQDQPYDLVEHLAWWTEFVIRHKGAKHLHTDLVWVPWYQRFDMDVVIFLTIVTCIAVSNALGLIIKFLAYAYKRRLHVKKQKTSCPVNVRSIN